MRITDFGGCGVMLGGVEYSVLDVHALNIDPQSA